MSFGTVRKILLLQPAVGTWDGMRTQPALPLSLLHAATLVHPEFHVEVFDQRVHPVGWERALANHLTPSLMLAGVTAFTGPMIQSGLSMCRLVRKLRPDVPIVWGGVHASLLPNQTVESPFADYVIQGEGEMALRDLCRALSTGRKPEGIPGVWWKENGAVHGTVPGMIPDLDALPDPPWDLVDARRYMPLYKGRRSYYFQSSRGCPLNCSYCYNVAYSRRRWRALSAEKTVERIRHLVETHGIEDVYFVDDMFFTSRRRALAIAEGLRELKITWQIQGVDIRGLMRLTDEQYRLIVESGCRRLTVGIESGSPSIRRYLKKEGGIGDIMEMARRLASYPITLYCSFMCGIPTETVEDIKATVDLMFALLKLNPHVRVSPLYNFSPYPGTELFEVALRHGMRPPDSLEGWALFRHDQANVFPERKRFYEALHFTSLFVDDKTREYGVPAWVRFLAKAYRPMARFRTRRLLFGGLIEKRAMDLTLAAWQRMARRPVSGNILHG